MKLTWRKLTTIILIVVSAILVIYNIITLNTSPNDVISRVMKAAIWKFPFTVFVWFGLGGHFISPFKTRKQYIKLMVIIASIVFLFSFLVLFNVIKISALILCLFALAGFITCALTWSMRRK